MEWRRHGFPPGYRFVPEDGELIGLLAMKMREEPLPLPDSVFRDIDLLKYHPQNYTKYKKYMEDGYIYFFSKRTFPKQAHRPKRATKHGRARKASGDRATRATRHGGAWKASGPCKAIVARNGVEIGRVRTMVYYDDKIIDEKMGKKKACDRTELVVQEFMITQPGTDKVADLALYRIYMKEDNNKKRKERCMEEAGSSSSAQQADDQSMDDGAAVSGGQRHCAGTVVTAAYGQGQLFSPCELPPTSVAEGQTDERRDQLVNEPAAMDGVSDRCYGPWSDMAQPYYNYWCAAPAAAPATCWLAHQQPTDEGAYLNGVGYVSGYAYDGFAGAAQSSGLDTAAGVSDEQFKHMMTREMVDQI